MRSLIPETMDGLLGAQGNVGFSSIVSAAIRLHDQRIHIGQAAGATAAVSLRETVDPREMVYDRALLEAVRDGLCAEEMEGMPLLLWPFRDLKPEDPWFVAANRLHAAMLLTAGNDEIDLDAPREIGEDSWLADRLAEFLSATGHRLVLSEIDRRPRSEFLEICWSIMRESDEPVASDPARADIVKRIAGTGGWRAWPRKSESDADGDGIPDRDDALLFTPNEPIVWELAAEKITPESDGLFPADLPASARRFDFAGKGVPETAGFERDSGAEFSEDRGFGWARDISANQRRRQAAPEPYRDTFLFTRCEDTWECEVENGRYAVVVCVGDSGHEQAGQNVTVEGRKAIKNRYTAAGRFHEAKIEVEVGDGRLTVTIGKPEGGSNTCLNWLTFWKVD